MKNAELRETLRWWYSLKMTCSCSLWLHSVFDTGAGLAGTDSPEGLRSLIDVELFMGLCELF